MRALIPFRAVYDNRFAQAAAIVRATGRPVIGYVDAGFPEEVALAAGFVPMLLCADPAQEFVATNGRLDLGTPHRVAAIIEGVLTGKYAGLDRLCITNGDRFLANIYGILEAEGAANGKPVLPHLMFMDRTRGSYAEHWLYNRAAIEKLGMTLGSATGRRVDAHSLRAAIVQVNAVRRLIADLQAVNRAAPTVLSGADLAMVQLCARLMPKEDFISAANALLDDLKDTTGGHPRRAFLCGSAVDHMALAQAIEAAGFAITGDATSLTGRYAADIPREDIGEIDALADQQTHGFPEPWAFGRDHRIARILAAFDASGATEAIYLHLREDSAAGWDYPDLADALRARGVTLRYLRDFSDVHHDVAELTDKLKDALQ